MDSTRFEHVAERGARLAILAAGSLAVIVGLALGQVILAPICLALIIGLMFGPLADFFERRGMPPVLSAAIVVLCLFAVLGIAAWLFAVPLSEWVARGPAVWEKLKTTLAGLKEPLQAVGAVQEQLKGILGNDAAMTVEVQGGGPVQDVALMAPSFLAEVLLFFAGLYFFLANRHHIRVATLSLCYSRQTRWRAAHVFRDVETKVSRFLLAATLINSCVGVATAAATWALGLPSPLLWGALAAIMNFVPYAGQAVMFAVLFAIGLATQNGVVPILLPVVAYAVINFIADQLVFPNIVGRALTLNPFIIFVSTAFWLWIWGPIGGLISVPSLLVLQSLILHIFPTTRSIPERSQRKLDQILGSPPTAEPAEAPLAPAEVAAPPPVAATPKPRARRKPAIAASP
jgi:predicted PurR-regulated permease PerM